MKRRAEGGVLAAALACIVLHARVAHAEPARVLVESSCAPAVLDPFELLYLLRVELPADRVQIGATLAELGSLPQPDLHLLLCAEDGRLDAFSLRVAGGPPQSRALDVSGLPVNARTRALALALAEIIGSTIDAAADPAPPEGAQGEAGAPPAAPAPSRDADAQPQPAQNRTAAPSAEQPPAERSDVEAWTAIRRVGAAFASRAVALPDALGHPTWLYGPAISVDIARWHASALLLLGRDDVQLGTIALASAIGSLAYDVWQGGGSIALAARVRGELAVSWASGEPLEGARARSAAALGAAALAEFALLAPLAGPWSLDLRIGTGYARGLGALADGRREATTHGFAAAASAGLSFELP